MTVHSRKGMSREAGDLGKGGKIEGTNEEESKPGTESR